MNALLIEDDPVFASTLARAVRGLGKGWEVVQTTTVKEALQVVGDENQSLQLALVDLTLPDGSGLDVIRALRQARPEVPALVISGLASENSVLSAVRDGARGYLHKSEPLASFSQAMAQVMQGHHPISPSLASYLFNRVRHEPPVVISADIQLTPKENNTLGCIAQGMSYNETALHMGVSLSTVQSHIRNLYRKLGVRSQVQAVGKAREKGLL